MGKCSVVEQVLAVGRFPSVKSMVGFDSKPIGGGTLAPVMNTSTSSSLADASLAIEINQKYNKNLHINIRTKIF